MGQRLNQKVREIIDSYQPKPLAAEKLQALQTILAKA